MTSNLIINVYSIAGKFIRSFNDGVNRFGKLKYIMIFKYLYYNLDSSFNTIQPESMKAVLIFGDCKNKL